MKPVNLKIKHYVGLNNPSGSVALNEHTFIVGDDEHNVLHIYDKAITRYPIQTLSLSSLFPGSIQDTENNEVDLEGATYLKGILFWIGSHSTSRTGRLRSARHRLFALMLTPKGNGQFIAQPIGTPYTQLLSHLSVDKRFNSFELPEASTIAPKDPKGLSIEGLAATPEGTLLIGFRNPLHAGKIKAHEYRQGKALIVELLNPLDVLTGATAHFADPISLDLHGYGIRDITWFRKHKYLIIAGPYHATIATNLYLWSRMSNKVKHIAAVKSEQLNLEAAIIYPDDRSKVQLLSDDGRVTNAQGFRSIELEIG